jgi:hypothetical protein
MAPKMLDDQNGSSDMIQSMAANVSVSPYSSRPGPLKACALRATSGS